MSSIILITSGTVLIMSDILIMSKYHMIMCGTVLIMSDITLIVSKYYTDHEWRCTNHK